MKIFSPVKDYTGMSASVPFCNGIGETDDSHLIEWFKDHGYGVEEVDTTCLEDQAETETVDQVETETVEQVETPKTKRTRK